MRKILTLGDVVDARQNADAAAAARESRQNAAAARRAARHEVKRCASLLRQAIDLGLGDDTIAGYRADHATAEAAAR